MLPVSRPLKNRLFFSVAEPEPVGAEVFLAGADLKFELEPIFFGWAPAPFFWEVKN